MPAMLTRLMKEVKHSLFNLDREPRFYAWVAFSGWILRSDERVN